MLKKSIIGFFAVVVNACFAQSPFELKVSSEKVILRSGGAESSVKVMKYASLIEIKKHGKIEFVAGMPHPFPTRYYC